MIARGEAGAWLLRTYGAGETLELAAVGAALAVDEIYAGVELDATPA